MGTNPEGSRDLSHARDDAQARPLTAVPPVPSVPPPPQVPRSPSGPLAPPPINLDRPDDEGELAEEYEAALEDSQADADLDTGVSTQAPTSADAPKPHLSEDEVHVPMTSLGESPSNPDETRIETVDRATGPVPKRDALFGQVLADRYRILDLIGKGGMGKVYLAEHVALGKRVAVKVLNPAYTNRPDQVKRFLREAQAASTIGHENVIDITDFGEMPNGQVFFAMEHLQGEDLGKLLKRSGAIPWARARRILLQMCRALQAAHGRGIIHRDMKPENCFVIHRNGIRDFVKVLDFGIAKFLEENRDGGSNPLTQIGALIGTPEYMAPEQIHGEAADLRMDIYSVGCIMYQLLTGNLPFTDKTMYGVLSQQVNVKPIPPRQVAPELEIPPEVEAIILKAMEKDKTLRYQTMAELIEAIVAAPRGAGTSTDAGRMGTTTNLDAAASAARLAAGIGPGGLPLTSPPGSLPAMTPSDMLIPGAQGSNSGMSPTGISAPQWAAGMDPTMLTRLVIGLGAAVLVLVVGLVCALSRSDDPEGARVVEGTAAEAPEAGPAKTDPVAPPPETKAVVPTPPETKAVPVKPDEETIVLDEPPDTKAGATDTKKDPAIKKDPIVKKTTKKDGPKPEVDSSKWPETLDPIDRQQVLKTYRADFEACRTIATPKGKSFRIKLRVDGPTGRVLEATPDDASAEGKCLAKVFRSKVRFARSRKTPQDLPMMVPL